uniref:BHLH domain-containing protein n=1 Tax=Chenopodium quinoa TaxID=63459 RepID=A0A803MRP6_CHEQI
MDSVFQLDNGDRVSYLCSLMQSFCASYICLWTYSPHLKILYCEDGHFKEEASSFTGVSISGRLFNEYKQSVFPVGNDFVPGLAFRDKNPSLKLQEIDLQRLASIELQRRFYKTAVFFGCERGEIELGMSNNQQNLEMKIQRLFSTMEFSRPTDQQNKPSSSSSQSMDSPEYTSLFYNFASSSTFHLQPEQPAAVIRETHPSIVDQHRTINTQSIPITTTTVTNTATSSVNAPQINHPLLQNIPFPTAETTDAALTKAYLAILSSPSSSSTGGEKSCPYGYQARQRASAFTSYHSSCSGSSSTQKRLDLRRQTLLKRAIAFYRGINYRRIQELSLQGPGRPTSNQLHHMISERKRREKINESFQALRSLLPPGTKKDKASVLRTTKEYLSSLKAQLSEVNKRNQLMEAQLKMRNEPKSTNTTSVDVSSNERLAIRVTPVSESTSSRGRMVDLQVILRMETSVPDLVIRVLEFLKQVKEATMVSMEAQTHQETTSTNNQFPTNWVTFRLRIEGEEWDESAFIEAIGRLLADLAS